MTAIGAFIHVSSVCIWPLYRDLPRRNLSFNVSPPTVIKSWIRKISSAADNAGEISLQRFRQFNLTGSRRIVMYLVCGHLHAPDTPSATLTCQGLAGHFRSSLGRANPRIC